MDQTINSYIAHIQLYEVQIIYEVLNKANTNRSNKFNSKKQPTLSRIIDPYATHRTKHQQMLYFPMHSAPFVKAGLPAVYKL
jgi:hypothetical protein